MFRTLGLAVSVQRQDMSATHLSPRTSSPVVVLPFAERGRELWHKSAPAALRAGAFAHEKQAWKLWRRHLAARQQLAPQKLGAQWIDLRCATKSQRGPAGGAAMSEIALAEAESLAPRKLEAKSRRLEAQARQWLAEATDQAIDPAQALDALVWAYALPALAQRLPGDVWWQLLDRLVDLAGGEHNRPLQVRGLAGQLLETELPLVLGYQFPEIKPCRRLIMRSGASLEAGIAEMLAADGMPRPGSLVELPQLFACWRRASVLARHARRDPWNEGCRRRLAQGVRQVSRLLDARGTQAAPGLPRVEWPKRLWSECVRELGDRRARAVGKWQQSAKHNSAKPARQKHLPSPSAQSDSACLAVLRQSWSPGAASLAVEHSGRAVQLEFQSAGQPLLFGQWNCEIVVDGTPRSAVTGWQASCWVADRDVAYLELEASYSGDVRVFRQLLLAREEQFLFLADVVVARQADSIAYRASLPCATGVSTVSIADHTELELIAGKRSYPMLPLALPEWRRQTVDSKFESSAQGCDLRQTGRGRALYAPLFIDLDRRRQRRQYTWRRLTVAETRQIVPPSVAAGFRVQRGRRQWLFYRTLTERAGRTVLGVNLWSEFLASCIDKQGESQPLIEVE